jgi:hypothetical protein
MKYYIIHKIHDGDGFFAKFNHVLMHLNEADSLGLIPYVDFTKPSNLRDHHNSINNEWEYCFNQDVSIHDVYKNNHQISNGLFLGWYPAQGKNYRNKELSLRLNSLFQKYVKVKPEILNNLNQEIKKFKTLAVHCRRSDMASFHPEIGLNYTNEIFFEKTMKIFNEGNFEKIYLATEEYEILDFFKRELGDTLIHQDCFRVGINESPVHKNDSRPLHRTLQCQEVLIDALNMSECESLLCGVSGVSNGVIYINGLKFNNVYYFDEIEN